MLNTEEERKCWFLPLVSEGSSPFWFGTPEQENTPPSGACGPAGAPRGAPQKGDLLAPSHSCWIRISWVGPGMPLGKMPRLFAYSSGYIGLDVEQVLPRGLSRPEGSASPGNLVEMQIFSPLQTCKIRNLGSGAQQSTFNTLSRRF